MKWPMVTLDTVLASLEAGSRPRGGTKDVKDGVPSLGGEHLNNNGGFNFTSLKYIPEEHFAIMRKGIVRLHDILVVKDGATTGKTSFVRDDFPFEHAAVNEHVFIVRVRPEIIHPAFAFYFLFSKRGQAEIHKDFRGATIGGISRQFPKKVNIPLPPLSEQRRIVEILDQADGLRKKRAEADAKAARILPALFYKMFGDPATNPKGWPTAPLGDVIEIGTQLVEPNQPEYLDLPHVGGEQIEKETGRILSPQLVRESNLRSGKFFFTAEHILYSKIRPYLNKVAYPRFDGVCSADIYPLRPKDKRISPWYLIALLRSQAFLSYARAHSERLRMPKLNRNQLGAFETPLPDTVLLEAFDKQAEEIAKLEEARFSQEDRIERLFDVLLHRAFTGDLTAQWREAHMKELLEEMEAQAKALEPPVVEKRVPKVKSRRHAGHDMYNKAALAAYITNRCHADDRPLGRVKVAKLFYLAQRKAELELTEQFALRAAGPVDDDIHKFLSLARKQKWVVLGRAQGDLKPVRPGKDITKGVEQAAKVLGAAKNKVDELLDLMKDWGWRTLERWATVLHAAEAIVASGGEVSVAAIKKSINEHPEWQAKLNRAEFSDENLASTLKGLREFGFLQQGQ